MEEIKTLLFKGNKLGRKFIHFILSSLFFAGIYTVMGKGNFKHIDITLNQNQLMHYHQVNMNNFLDCFYYSTMIQASVGFGDIIPISKQARFITIIQCFVSLLILIY